MHSGVGNGFGTAPPGRLPLATLAGVALWICAFSGFYVQNDPAPYDILAVLLAGVAFLYGLPLSRTVAPLAILLVVYLAGGLIAATQLPDFERAPTYLAATALVCISAIFFAAATARTPHLHGAIARGYLAGALLAALAGIVGYFNLVPGAGMFTLYDRARGTFQDPNVFGPFLIFPACLLTYTLLTRPLHRGIFPGLLLLVLLAGIFLSFSRASWAVTGLALLGTGLIAFINERNPLGRLRLASFGLIGVVVFVMMLAYAIQTSAIAELFRQRAELVQSYDASHFGRFARHGLGFLLAGETPLGIGPLQFYKLFTEDPHNMYLKGFVAYGWIGGIAYLVLQVWTLVALFPLIFKARATQAIAVAVFTTMVGHAVNALVIDMDHWRHLFLLYGLAWGLIANERRLQSERSAGNFPQPAERPCTATPKRIGNEPSERSAAW